MTACIQCEQIGFGYVPEKPVLKNVSLTFSQGEFVGVVGANGSGKTTLARLLHGSLTPTAGTIRITSADLKNQDDPIVLVGSDPESQLICSTVFEEVAFSLRAALLPATEVFARTQEALMLFDLLPYAQQHPGLLSIGEQLRVLIASAVVRKPTYLLLDEVASMLDAKHWRLIVQILLALRASTKMGLLLITHRLEDLHQADRVIVLREGSVVMEDRVEAIFSRVLDEPNWNIDVPLLYRVCEQITSPPVRALLAVQLPAFAFQEKS